MHNNYTWVKIKYKKACSDIRIKWCHSVGGHLPHIRQERDGDPAQFWDPWSLLSVLYSFLAIRSSCQVEVWSLGYRDGLRSLAHRASLWILIRFQLDQIVSHPMYIKCPPEQIHFQKCRQHLLQLIHYFLNWPHQPGVSESQLPCAFCLHESS